MSAPTFVAAQGNALQSLEHDVFFCEEGKILIEHFHRTFVYGTENTGSAMRLNQPPHRQTLEGCSTHPMPPENAIARSHR